MLRGARPAHVVRQRPKFVLAELAKVDVGLFGYFFYAPPLLVGYETTRW